MNFAIIRPAAPIRPAGQAAPGTSSNFVSFLILGGLAVGAYYWWTAESAPAPATRPASEPLRTLRGVKAGRPLGVHSKQERDNFQKLSTYLKKTFPGTTVAAEGHSLVAIGSFPTLPDELVNRLDKAGSRLGFHLKETSPTELFFEAR